METLTSVTAWLLKCKQSGRPLTIQLIDNQFIQVANGDFLALHPVTGSKCIFVFGKEADEFRCIAIRSIVHIFDDRPAFGPIEETVSNNSSEQIDDEVALSPAARSPETNAYQDDDRLTTKEVASLLRVSEWTVYRWATTGRIPCQHLSNRVLRFRFGDVRKAVDHRTTGKRFLRKSSQDEYGR
jgi:excisionase family DNA binding protein